MRFGIGAGVRGAIFVDSGVCCFPGTAVVAEGGVGGIVRKCAVVMVEWSGDWVRVRVRWSRCC